MGTTHNYTAAELPTNEIDKLHRLTYSAGYTPSNLAVWNPGDNTYDVTVDETAVDKATLLSALGGATDSTLSVDTSSLEVAGDGIATGTITVTDSRGAGASGKTVKLRMLDPGILRLSGESLVLDGLGQATLTVKATPSDSTCCAPIVVEFYYDSGEAKPVRSTIRYTA